MNFPWEDMEVKNITMFFDCVVLDCKPTEEEAEDELETSV